MQNIIIPSYKDTKYSECLFSKNFIHNIKLTIKYVRKLLVTYYQQQVLLYKGGISFLSKSINLQECRVISYGCPINYRCMYLKVLTKLETKHCGKVSSSHY